MTPPPPKRPPLAWLNHLNSLIPILETFSPRNRMKILRKAGVKTEAPFSTLFFIDKISRIPLYQSEGKQKSY